MSQDGAKWKDKVSRREMLHGAGVVAGGVAGASALGAIREHSQNQGGGTLPRLPEATANADWEYGGTRGERAGEGGGDFADGPAGATRNAARLFHQRIHAE